MALFNKKMTPSPQRGAKPTAVTYQLRAGAALLPVATEKATRLQQSGQYTFAVRGQVTKLEIKRAVESVFGVRVLGVNSVSLPGKVVRRGRTAGRQRARRHLVVRLGAGQTIDLSRGM
ncbi:MAG: 50S ribosomal protein L23 [Candidatus Veblenbacteria bacterium]|nr:50S ribosomal protein L23 [Candidatus Veblenbacteria bacterium]MDZ4230092.1 50S ribosomal protein L23 [Candidatus Veblenbacteria bacterium]